MKLEIKTLSANITKLREELDGSKRQVESLEEQNQELTNRIEALQIHENQDEFRDQDPGEFRTPSMESNELEYPHTNYTTVEDDNNPMRETSLKGRVLFPEKTKSEARFSLPKVLELSGESCKYLKGEIIKINRNPLSSLENKKKKFEELFLNKVKEEFKNLDAEEKINESNILEKEIRELSNHFFDSGHFSILGTITKEGDQLTITSRIITESDMSLSSNDKEDRRYYKASFTRCEFNQTENSEPNIFGNANLFMANFNNCIFRNVDFSDIDLEIFADIKFSKCNFENCVFNEKLAESILNKLNCGFKDCKIGNKNFSPKEPSSSISEAKSETAVKTITGYNK